jgi:hypothetical protein
MSLPSSVRRDLDRLGALGGSLHPAQRVVDLGRRRRIGLFLVFQRRHVPGEQAEPKALDEVARTPRALRNGNVELRAAGAFPAADQFLERPLVLPERASDVVRGAGGKHCHGNAASRDPAGDAPDRPIAAGDDDQLGRFLERALPAGLFRRAIAHVVSSTAQELAQALAVLVLVPGGGVMNQRNKHVISLSNR